MKKFFVFLLVIMISAIISNDFSLFAIADEMDNADVVYSVYDDDFNLLCEKDFIAVGDGYMSPDRKYYEIVYVDEDLCYGIAKFVKKVELPNVTISYNPRPIKTEKRVICLYMSHNDECYLPTDGVDSVYGNGGIKDVAVAFQKNLNNP